MGIKVIKRGAPPEEATYKARCKRCGSEMEWQRKDAKRDFPGDRRDGPFTQIDCPVCGALVSGY